MKSPMTVRSQNGATRDTDQTPELTRIGFQQRRDAGTLSQPAKPPAPAAAPAPPKP